VRPKRELSILNDKSSSVGVGSRLADIAVVLLLASAVIAISAHAPTHIYAYAQPWNIGAAVSIVQDGDWLLPRIQTGAVARKPQLYAWLTAAAIKLTGRYDEFVFRLPTVLASLVLAVLVYWLADCWFGRPVGLLAACLWVTISHMHKLMYLGTTDMLLALWLAVCVLCVDRLLLHPVARPRRTPWVIGLWTGMILAALTKGWGVVNVPLIGAFVALTAALKPGFEVLRTTHGAAGKTGLLVRLIVRRWWRAIRAIRLGWGVLAVLAIMGPLLAAMLVKGGGDFRSTLYFEIWQRITGAGPSPPAAADAPSILYLFYYTLPVSLYAACSLVLLRPARWFSRRSPLSLPLCWIAAVVVPFSFAHGFRPDYLLPCYFAVAMLGAWAVVRLDGLGAAAGRLRSALRHVIAAGPVLIGSIVTLAGVFALISVYLPASLRRMVKGNPAASDVTWWGTAVCVALGVGVLGVTIRASLRWRLRTVAAAGAVGMLGVFFLYTHVYSSAAAGDGEKMVAFARRVEGIIDGDEFAVAGAEKLCTQLFLGRFGRRVTDFDELGGTQAKWLITCDLGLRRLRGVPGRRLRPADLGRVYWASPPIKTKADNFGRAYLIRLGERPDLRVWPVPVVR